MKIKSMPILYINLASFLVLLILFEAKSICAQEVDDEREFDYSKNSEKGPTKWGEIKKEWAACNHGTMQSPIDMSNERVMIISKPEMIRNYKVCNTTVKNRGHDIQIEWIGDAGSVFINSIEYHLRYAHWHSPSEHTINGRRYAMELHMVHLSKDPSVKNKIAVIGMFYKIGKADEFLSKLMTNISSMINKKHEERILGTIDPRDIKIRSKKYYRYMGSLTVPPCTEGVVWTINKKVKTVSREQIKLFREAVHDYAEENARPLQPKNSRDVYLYGPGNTSN